MAGKTHRVTVRGQEIVEACERRFGSFCPFCDEETVPIERVMVPFRPSPGLPPGWSEVAAEEV